MQSSRSRAPQRDRPDNRATRLDEGYEEEGVCLLRSRNNLRQDHFDRTLLDKVGASEFKVYNHMA